MKAVLFSILLLSGCASTIPGVKISESEREACAASQDCTVWTKQELTNFANQVIRWYRSQYEKEI